MNLKNILNKLELKHISDLNSMELNKILSIRNEKNIRKNMVSKNLITQEEHIIWTNSIKNSKKNFFYAVFYLDKIIGGVGLYNVNNINKISHWGFYVSSLVKINGLGAALEFGLINFVFQKVGLEKLNCEVIETNEAVVKLHKKFGFVEEGFRRENIIKNENRMGVFFLGLTKSDWEREKETVKNRYEKVIDKFDLEIEYEPA